jgi:hypothetical protein
MRYTKMISLQPLLLCYAFFCSPHKFYLFIYLVLAVAAVTQQTATVLVCFSSCLVSQGTEYWVSLSFCLGSGRERERERERSLKDDAEFIWSHILRIVSSLVTVNYIICSISFPTTVLTYNQCLVLNNSQCQKKTQFFLMWWSCLIFQELNLTPTLVHEGIQWPNRSSGYFIYCGLANETKRKSYSL